MYIQLSRACRGSPSVVNDPPRLAVSLGDPAGIGPEVVCKWLAAPATRAALAAADFEVLLVGAPATLASGLQVALSAGLAEADGTHIAAAPVARAQPLAGSQPLQLLDTGIAPDPGFRLGQVDARCGAAALAAVEQAARLCLAGKTAAMVTAPINKASLHAAGSTDIGHQEVLARLAGVDWTATMLMTPGLRVAHLSTHKSLAEAVRYVTRDNVLGKLQLTHRSLTAWGLPAPRIAVSALNPHGGEAGLLGREEIDQLLPAVADARRQGIDAHGPIPADSVFNRAIDGEFDVVLALYHDQGHIAIKVHDFHNSVTATLGLPFIRTSVDHGTAFDIAGQGIADASGMAAAAAAALALARGRLAEFQPMGHSNSKVE